MKQHKQISGISCAIRKFSPSLDEIEPNKGCDGFHIRIATTKEEVLQALSLVYDEYLRKGYTEENSYKLYLKEFDFHPQTTIFIVTNSSNIIGTGTLVIDKYNCLPASKIFSNELKLLNITKRSIVEVSRLAMKNTEVNSKIALSKLINYMFIYGTYIESLEETIIQVNPRHTLFYQKYLDFKCISCEKDNNDVNNAPAILLHLPLQHFYAQTNFPTESKKRNLYHSFLRGKELQEAINELKSHKNIKINSFNQIKKYLCMVQKDKTKKPFLTMHFV